MEQEQAKRLLLRSVQHGNGFFWMDWTLNLYRGCNHGCIYCDSRSECYHIERFGEVRAKKNALLLLGRELCSKQKAGVVFMGAASDPYNVQENHLCITKGALELLLRYGFGIGMSTKSALIARDASLLGRFKGKAPAMAAFSITTADDALAARLEPGASPPSDRFEAMRALAGEGVFTGTWLNPVLPYITDTQENIRRIVDQTYQNGGRFVICHFGMTLRTGSREYFYQALDRDPLFYGIKQKYASAFGLDYLCPSPQAAALQAVLKEACEKKGMYWRFQQVNAGQRAQCPAQTTLLDFQQP